MNDKHKAWISRLAECSRKRSVTWDALWNRQSIGRIAVAVMPGEEDMKRARKIAAGFPLDEPLEKPPHWTQQWHDSARAGIATVLAETDLAGDRFPSLGVPRFLHGQSQGICDLFGARVEAQEDGNYFVHPLEPEPTRIASIEARPLETSLYWNAVEYIRYARTATGGVFSFRNPVMTGPLDTANYLLGTTVLMEWLNTEPDTVQCLLGAVSAVIAGMITELRKAAGGELHGDAIACARGGVCFCSECRSLISQETYETFEAPWLRWLGEQIGPYAIHSCGGWERTVSSALRDPNLRAMNGQVRENDLATLCTQAEKKLLLSINPSENLNERYTWPDRTGYLNYILDSVPDGQLVEICIRKDEIPLWNQLCARHGRCGNRIDTVSGDVEYG